MKRTTCTWIDDDTKLYRRTITITNEDGSCETVEGKGRSYKDAKSDAESIYNALMEAALPNSSTSTKAESPNIIHVESSTLGRMNTQKTRAVFPVDDIAALQRDVVQPRNSGELGQIEEVVASGYKNSMLTRDDSSRLAQVEQGLDDCVMSTFNPSQQPLVGVDEQGESTNSGPVPSVFSAHQTNDRGSPERAMATRSGECGSQDSSQLLGGIDIAGKRDDGDTLRGLDREEEKDMTEIQGDGKASVERKDEQLKKMISVDEQDVVVMMDKSEKCATECDGLDVEFNDGGEDWVSKFNVFKDRVKHRFERRFDKITYSCTFVKRKESPEAMVVSGEDELNDVREGMKGKDDKSSKGVKESAHDWICTMSVRDRKRTEGNEEKGDVMIMVKKKSSNKKEAKKIAARFMIERIKSILDEEKGGLGNAFDSDFEMTSTEGNATAILHLWWQRDLVDGKPEMSVREVAGKAGDVLWEGTYNVQVKYVKNAFSFRRTDCSKQGVWKKLALAAVMAINELDLPGFREALVHRRRNTMKGRYREEESCPDNTEDMVQHTDEEIDVFEENAEQTMFKMQEDYRVVLAKSIDDCEIWVKGLLKEPLDVGVYVDSVVMREEMMDIADLFGYNVAKHDRKCTACRVICLATERCALLLNMEYFMTEKGVNEIPKCVCDVFNTKEIRLFGMWPEWSKTALWYNYGVNCSSEILNLSIHSFALSGGVFHNGECIHSTKSVCELWMKLTFQPFAQSVIHAVPGLQDLIDSTDALIAPAVPGAVLCVKVAGQFKKKTSSLEQQCFSQMDGFDEIAQRLTHDMSYSRQLKRRTGQDSSADIRDKHFA